MFKMEKMCIMLSAEFFVRYFNTLYTFLAKMQKSERVNLENNICVQYFFREEFNSQFVPETYLYVFKWCFELYLLNFNRSN